MKKVIMIMVILISIVSVANAGALWRDIGLKCTNNQNPIDIKYFNLMINQSGPRSLAIKILRKGFQPLEIYQTYHQTNFDNIHFKMNLLDKTSISIAFRFNKVKKNFSMPFVEMDKNKKVIERKQYTCEHIDQKDLLIRTW